MARGVTTEQINKTCQSVYYHLHKIRQIRKAIHHLGPAYLSNLLNIKRCTCSNLRSNVGVILQDPTAKFKCTLGDRSFTAAAQKIWNGLPDHIRKDNDFGYV